MDHLTLDQLTQEHVGKFVRLSYSDSEMSDHVHHLSAWVEDGPEGNNTVVLDGIIAFLHPDTKIYILDEDQPQVPLIEVFLINEETVPELMNRTGLDEDFFKGMISFDEEIGCKAYFFPVIASGSNWVQTGHMRVVTPGGGLKVESTNEDYINDIAKQNNLIPQRAWVRNVIEWRNE